jgi:gamma-glutamylcyclotransferase (GGCT)/AIG2-like uncharacterized protein YtfP
MKEPYKGLRPYEKVDQNNPQQMLIQAVYESKGSRASGLLKNYFRQQISQFSAAEKKLASAAFNYLVNKHGTKMAYPVGDLAKLLRVDEATLIKTLDKLEQARVLQRQIRQSTMEQGKQRVLWYELYHDIFSKSIYDWNEQYKNRQRLIRLALGAGLVVSAVGAALLGYEGWINYMSYHVQLSLKSGISDTIELYQGKAGARDIFGQPAYWYETNYHRADIEADKLFNHQPIEVPEQLNKKLVEKSRLTNQLQTYWDNGEVDKTNCLAHILKNDSKLSTATLTSLTHFRSVTGFEWLKQFAQRGDQQLQATIQSALLNIQAPPDIWFSLRQEPSLHPVATLALVLLGYKEIVSDLIKSLKNSDSAIRNRTIQALGALKAKVVLSHLVESLDGSAFRVSNSAIQTLGALEAQAAIPQLIKRLKDSDSDVRNSTVQALGQLRTEEAITPLITLFNQEKKSAIRRSIAFVLLDWGNEEAINALIELLKSADAKVTITPKPLQAHRWQTFVTHLQQENIATQNQALKLFKTLPPKLAFAAISQLSPLLVASDELPSPAKLGIVVFSSFSPKEV